jgi:hypothetical protein
MNPEGRPGRRVFVGLWLAVALIGAGIALRAGRDGSLPRGNALVVINAGSGGLDSIVVEPAPPPVGTDPPPGPAAPAGRAGYLAAQDSLVLTLPPTTGDAHIRAFRGGRAVADQVVYFGGETVFELRVGDADRLGRYRRMR